VEVEKLDRKKWGYNTSMKPSVYVETSVISYLAARPNRDLIIAANQQVTQEWWREKRPAFDLFVSQLVLQEVGIGDPDAIERRRNALKEVQILALNEDAISLARQLVARGAIPPQAIEDALHVAIAAVNGMNYLVTWNYKHIANAAMRAGIEMVCREAGFEPPVICSLLELMEV
jgi:predicted nucleic acid-binding protein